VGVGTQTTICAVGPGTPLTSRNLTLTTFSPGLNDACALIKSQNWMVAVLSTSFSMLLASVKVQGLPGLNTWKRQAKSLSAPVTSGSAGSNVGGLMPGTPSGEMPQTTGFPLPSCWVL